MYGNLGISVQSDFLFSILSMFSYRKFKLDNMRVVKLENATRNLRKAVVADLLVSLTRKDKYLRATFCKYQL